MELKKVLFYLGISSDKIGFEFLVSAINKAKNKKHLVNLTNIYEQISIENNNNISKFSVERAIRYAIVDAYKKNKTLRKIYSKRPNNKLFICDLAFNKKTIESIIKQNSKR